MQQIANETDSISSARLHDLEHSALQVVKRTSRRRGTMITALGLSLAAALLVSGCSSTPPASTETPAPTAESSAPAESPEAEAEAPSGGDMDSLTCDQIGEFVAAEFDDVLFDEEKSAGPKLYCYWGSSSTPPRISVTVSTNSKRDGNGSPDLCAEDAQMTMLHGALDPEDFSAYNGCLRVQPLEATAVNLWVQAADGLVEVDVQGAESPREKGVALIRHILDAS